MALINGTWEHDRLVGTTGNDTINGLDGNDTLAGSAGTDFYDGGAGFDTLDLRGTLADLAVNLSAGTLSGGFNGTFASIERVWSGDGNDSLTGTAGADSFSARGGSDTLAGGTGVDTLWGGTQADTFVFRESGTANADSIGDWASGSDKLLLDGTVMTALGAAGNFAAGDARFWSSASGMAHDADDRVVYNTTTRQIFYDADGSGAGAAVLIATLQTGATLVATDIVVEGSTPPPAGQTINGTSGNDSLVGGNGNDTINGLDGTDILSGLAGNDLLDGGAGADSLYGGDGSDTLLAGGAGASGQRNFLDGGAGADSMVGGSDGDIFMVNDAGDSVSDSGGHDAIFSTITYVAPDWVEQLSLQGQASINATANNLNNNLHGNSGANVLEGLGGDDAIDGLEGNDSILGGDGNDALYGGEGFDTIGGGAGNDRLEGGPGHDSLSGGEGSDIFALGYAAAGSLNAFIADFQSGVDTLELDANYLGSLGASGRFASDDSRFYSAPGASAAHDISDRIIYNTSNGALYWDPDGIGSTWQAQLIATIQPPIEGGARLAASDILIINGTAPSGSTITGTDGNDSLFGTWAGDQIEALAGDDTVQGRDGNDLILGGSGNDSLFGEWNNDELEGGDGDDWLDGGYGIDALRGGSGNDTMDGGPNGNFYYTGSGFDQILFTQAPGESNLATIYEFSSGQDKLVLDRAVMAALGDTGNFAAGDARFYAAAGASAGHDATDRLIFNTSNGSLYYDADGSGAQAAQRIASFTVGTSLVASDIAVFDRNAPKHLVGTSGNDTLTGAGGNDTIEGLAGDDTIYAEDGDDSLMGGEGDDSLWGGFGADTMDGGAGDDYLIGAEGYWDDDGASNALTGGDGHDTLVGGVGDDSMLAGNGDDVLDGNYGADTMDGGSGNDTYYVYPGWTDGEPINDDVIFDSGGIDEIRVYYMDWVLGEGFENLTVASEEDDAGDRVLTGNELDNRIDGSQAASARIEGLEGNDTLMGGWGSYWDDGADAANWLDGGSGDDLLEGRYGNDTMLGGEGDDYLDALLGADVLDGGAGNDTLVGGDNPWGEPYQAADLFRFSVVAGEAHADRIVDFSSGEDEIELTAAAHIGIGAGGRFSASDGRFWADAGARSGHDGDDRVIYDTSTGDLFYDADGSGQGAALRIATLQNAPALASSDIVVTGASIPATAGDDSIVGTSADDVIFGAEGNDTISGLRGSDLLDGGSGNDSLDGGDDGDQLVGGDGNDTLVSGDGGIDTLDGGAGDDVYFAGFGDVLLDDGGLDTVFAYYWTLGAGFENLTVTSGYTTGRGNELGNVLRADGRYNVQLYGEAGNDTLHGGENGNLEGGAGNDQIFGGSGADTIHGDLGDDTLSGGAGSDAFNFGAVYGRDQIDGGAGIDSLGFDATRSSGVVVNLAAGTLSGGGAAGDGATLTGIENVTGSGLADVLIGDGSANSFYGGDGDDRLDGGGGNDFFSGLGGSDSFEFTVAPGAANADLIVGFTSGADKLRIDGTAHAGIGASGNFVAGDARFAANSSGTAQDASDRVVYNTTNGQLWYDADGNGAGAAQLIATVQGTTLAATDIEVINGTVPGQVITGTGGNDTLVGAAGNDTINGLAGNDSIVGGGGSDSLDGGDGTDTIDGGDGNDTYVGTSGDVLVDSSGIDTVVTGVSWTLGTGFENLTLSGTAAASATGNSAANVLTGNSAGNALAGGAGNDTLTGGAGADRFSFSEAPSAANADLLTEFTSASDKLVLDGTVHTGIGATGSFAPGDARFWSSTSGMAHDADDRVIYNMATGQLWYDADGNGAGAAQLVATVQDAWTVAATDIEVVNGTAPAGQVINGTAGNDNLVGAGGNDTINSLAGSDTLAGSGGNDFYDGGTGFDTLDLRGTLTDLSANLSAGTLSGGFNGTFVNIERVWSGDGNDSLTGTAGADSFSARGGSDTLTGGAGVDTLWGGTQADTFIFRETGTANADSIGDWASGSDTLALDNATLTALGADGDFVAGDARFAAGAGFTSGRDASDRVVYNTATGSLYYDADGSGAGAAQLIATLQSGTTVAATDIVVI